MRTIKLPIVIVIVIASFSTGYLTSSVRHRQEESTRKETIKKDAVEFRGAEKSLNDMLKLPERRPKKNHE